MRHDDHEAFRAFYREHYRPVCRFLSVRTEASSVEDVASEVFAVAWRRFGDVPERPLPWLLGTASKCLANHRRGRDRRIALVDRLAEVTSEHATTVEEAVDGSAQRRALLGALASLDERDREVLLLRHWDGLPPREIATVLGVTAVAARARAHRAGSRLQRALSEALEHEQASPSTSTQLIGG